MLDKQIRNLGQDPVPAKYNLLAGSIKNIREVHYQIVKEQIACGRRCLATNVNSRRSMNSTDLRPVVNRGAGDFVLLAKQTEKHRENKLFPLLPNRLSPRNRKDATSVPNFFPTNLAQERRLVTRRFSIRNPLFSVRPRDLLVSPRDDEPAARGYNGPVLPSAG